MVQPNASCEFFCDFILLQVTKRLTEARKTLVQDIRQASIDVTTVTDTDWNNFVLTAEDFYSPWLIYSSFKT
jgi:hypothetical protein